MAVLKTIGLFLHALRQPLILIVILPWLMMGDWPAWRGARQDGIADEKVVPVTWGTNSSSDAAPLAWRSEIQGWGRSSPVISRDRLFITTSVPAPPSIYNWLLLLLATTGFLAALENVRRTKVSPYVLVVGFLCGLATAPLFVADFDQITRNRIPTYIAGLPVRYVVAVGLLGLSTMCVWIRSGIQQMLWLVQVVMLASFFGVTAAAAMLPSTYWDNTTPAQIWLRSGMVGLVGVVVILTGLQPKRWRAWLGYVVLVGSTLALIVGTPTAQYGASWPLYKRLVLIGPLLVYMVIASVGEPLFRNRSWLVLGSAVGSLAVLFIDANYLHHRTGNRYQLLCFEAFSGKQLWSTTVFDGRKLGLVDQRGSAATPTPAVAGNRILVQFSGITAAVDWNGKLLWRNQEEVPDRSVLYGVGSSPVIYGSRVITVYERERLRTIKPSWVEVNDVESGRRIWRYEQQDSCCTYSTPILYPPTQPDRILLLSGRELLALSLSGGKLLWRKTLPVWEVCTTPVVEGDLLIVAGGSVQRAILGIKVGDEGTGEVVWQTTRAVPDCSSPVIANGTLFMVARNGIASALNPRTGKAYWRQRLVPGEYFASLVAAGGNIYAMNTEGATTVFAASDRYQAIGQNILEEPVIASPAIAGGWLFIRGNHSLYAIRPVAGAVARMP